MVSLKISGNALRRVRRALIKAAKSDPSRPVRVYGTKAAGYNVTIDSGEKSVIVSPRLSSRLTAEHWARLKIGRRPTVRTVADIMEN